MSSPRSVVSLVLVSLLGATPLACAHKENSEIRVPEAPERVRNLDEFADALNRYALLRTGDPLREAYRKPLREFLVRHLDVALAADDEDEALSSLEYAVALHRPAELRTVGPNADLTRVAASVYRIAAKQGAEEPAFLALAVQQQFGTPKEREDVSRKWLALEDWLVRNSTFATEPMLRHEELEQALEVVATQLPSPFVVQRLADLYVARYAAARQTQSRGAEIGTAARHRAEITGYLLLRLYLRADDLDGAIAALERIDVDPPTRKLAESIAGARGPNKSARPLLSLAEQFVPDASTETEIPQVFVNQGWGIAANLGQRAVNEFPKDPYARLLLARSLVQEGLIDAAIVHLQRAIAEKEDLFDAWEQLADLQQLSLVRLASINPDAAAGRLEDSVEPFHRRAAQLWRDRPIRPGLAQSIFAVAEGYYDRGRADDAKRWLQRGLDVEPTPATLDLLGTIELKRANLTAAEKHYETLTNLAFGSDQIRLHWEARARGQLGEVARRRGQAERSSWHARAAVMHLNMLMSRPDVSDETRASYLVQRGRLLFELGEMPIASNDFLAAIELAPGEPSSYADPLLFLVSRGHYDAAREIYERAIRRDELDDGIKLYFTLWINELALLQQQPPNPEIDSFLAGYRGRGWEQKLALHARGRLTFEQLLANAHDRGERTEAFFYEGLKRWRAGDSNGAKTLLQRVLEAGMMSYFEYDMAQAYLESNGLPKAAKPPHQPSQATVSPSPRAEHQPNEP